MNERHIPVNISAVRQPTWTGDRHDMAVLVSRGEPARTDAQMADAVRAQVLDYLAAWPPHTLGTTQVTPAVARATADHIASELTSGMRPGAAAMLTREHVLLYLGMAYERARR